MNLPGVRSSSTSVELVEHSSHKNRWFRSSHLAAPKLASSDVDTDKIIEIHPSRSNTWAPQEAWGRVAKSIVGATVGGAGGLFVGALASVPASASAVWAWRPLPGLSDAALEQWGEESRLMFVAAVRCVTYAGVVAGAALGAASPWSSSAKLVPVVPWALLGVYSGSLAAILAAVPGNCLAYGISNTLFDAVPYFTNVSQAAVVGGCAFAVAALFIKTT